MSAVTSGISIEEIKKIPYLVHEKLLGRMIPTLSFFDKGEWRRWFLHNGELLEIKGGIPIEAVYFSVDQEQETDLYLNFLNFVVQRAFWPEAAAHYLNGIRSDIHNLATSLAKLDYFYKTRGDIPGIQRWATTEIEYIFFVCRSIFDLLQKTIASIWDKVELTDKKIYKTKLPSSFSDMSLYDNKLQTDEEIVKRKHIPIDFAQFYIRQSQFFQMLKRYRDDLMHKGEDVAWVYATERGFAIQDHTIPFRDFGVWNEEHKLPNGLASARPIIAHVIHQTLQACEDFSTTIQKIILFPPEIVPGFRLFIRGQNMSYLLDLDRIQQNCLWWDE